MEKFRGRCNPVAVRYDKTQRQLLLFEIIFKSQEIMMPEVMKRLSASRKTIQRDIDDLTDAGLVKLEYTRKGNAYIKREGTDIAAAGINEPKDTLRYMHLKKLRRLVCFMIELSDMEDVSDLTRKNYSPGRHYFEMFPDVSERTRMRDYKTLKEIGYSIEWDDVFEEYRATGHLYDDIYRDGFDDFSGL